MHGQRGLSSSIQLTILFPLFIGIFLLTLQWAMLFWADAAAQAAAEDAAHAAAAYGANASDGQRLALEAAATPALQQVRVSASRDSYAAHVTIEAKAFGILPFFPTTIRAEASAPNEHVPP